MHRNTLVELDGFAFTSSALIYLTSSEQRKTGTQASAVMGLGLAGIALRRRRK